MYPWQISGMASSKAQTQEQHLILIATAKNIEKSIVLKLRSRPFWSLCTCGNNNNVLLAALAWQLCAHLKSLPLLNLKTQGDCTHCLIPPDYDHNHNHGHGHDHDHNSLTNTTIMTTIMTMTMKRNYDVITVSHSFSVLNKNMSSLDMTMIMARPNGQTKTIKKR